MPIHVAFIHKDDIFNPEYPMIGNVRASEAVADAGTGALSARDGEFAYVVNTGTAVAYIAHGATPDASATTETAATSARYALGAGVAVPVQCATGDKFATAVG